jgi:hypothetical protein
VVLVFVCVEQIIAPMRIICKLSCLYLKFLFYSGLASLKGTGYLYILDIILKGNHETKIMLVAANDAIFWCLSLGSKCYPDDLPVVSTFEQYINIIPT